MDIKKLLPWENYTDTAAQSSVRDDAKRPPLTAKSRYVPVHLYDEPMGQSKRCVWESDTDTLLHRSIDKR